MVTTILLMLKKEYMYFMCSDNLALKINSELNGYIENSFRYNEYFVSDKTTSNIFMFNQYNIMKPNNDKLNWLYGNCQN